MKRKKNILKTFAFLISATAAVNTACVDEIEFGNSFLEKASGGDVTSDTVFSNVTYVTQYLNTLYSMQYYGIPYCNTYSQQSAPYQESNDIYVGKTCMLTDCYVTTYGFGLKTSYLQGTHTSNYGNRADKFHYINNRVWSAVRYAYLLMERIDEVPNMSDETKASYVAQAKCIVASRCFDVFRHYGAVPIIDHAFTGSESTVELPRATVAEYVDYLTGLLDDAIKVLPWQLSNPSADLGHWTKAGAMALKCKILQFAASPLFNSEQPYYPGATDNLSVWYGNYDQQRWADCLKACEEFFAANDGSYYLWPAADNSNAGYIRPEDYRLAYRNGYSQLESPEVLHSVRHFTTDAYKSGYYVWHQWMSPTVDSNGGGVINRAYYPTQEYAEMFPWADGRNFDWDEAEQNGDKDVAALTVYTTDKNMTANPASADAKTQYSHTLDHMFGKMTLKGKSPSYYNLTRDPRLYEEMWCNGMPYTLDWTTGNMSGTNIETWVGGTHSAQTPVLQQGTFATGYGLMKWVMGDDYLRLPTQWVTLRLSDIYLTYAEALAQTGNLAKACEQINIVRARVGLPGIAESNPQLNLLSDKDALIEEILRERACELGMEDSRFFELIRYKRADIFEKKLHALCIYWLKNGQRNESAWYNGNKILRGYYPTEFEYEKVEWSQSPRSWWTDGFDPKWYLSPFPITEINKGYGLVQNPGW